MHQICRGCPQRPSCAPGLRPFSSSRHCTPLQWTHACTTEETKRFGKGFCSHVRGGCAVGHSTPSCAAAGPMHACTTEENAQDVSAVWKAFEAMLQLAASFAATCAACTCTPCWYLQSETGPRTSIETSSIHPIHLIGIFEPLLGCYPRRARARVPAGDSRRAAGSACAVIDELSFPQSRRGAPAPRRRVPTVPLAGTRRRRRRSKTLKREEPWDA